MQPRIFGYRKVAGSSAFTDMRRDVVRRTKPCRTVTCQEDRAGVLQPSEAVVKVISIINYKGGVGKTTLTANLGAELAARGRRVLLIDMDPQNSLTFSFYPPAFWASDLRERQTIKAWYDIVSERRDLRLADLVTAPPMVNQFLAAGKGRLDLIASHIGLVDSDIRLAELGGSSGHTRASAEAYVHVHHHLRDGLSDVQMQRYDYVLIDCPPHFSMTTRTALVASDHVIVPSKADYLSMLGISYLKGHHLRLVGDYNTACRDLGTAASINPTTLGVVFTMVQYMNGAPVAVHHNYITHVRAIGFPIFKARIRYNATVFGGAGETGVPVVLLGGNDTITDEIVGMTSEVLTRIDNPTAAAAWSEGKVA